MSISLIIEYIKKVTLKYKKQTQRNIRTGNW